MRCFERFSLTLTLDFNRANTPSCDVDAYDLASQELRSALSGRLQHDHAKLLGAQPAGAARVRHCHSLGREIRKVPPDQTGVGDDISAGQGEVVSTLGRWCVGLDGDS